MKRALVTGGAGLIGSHVADLLRQEGWWVRVLDNLEPQTHRHGRPAWVQGDENFIEGDVCDSATLRAALDGIDLIFHQAAYGGYMPEIAKYVAVNSFGTAQMLEMIREEKCWSASDNRAAGLWVGLCRGRRRGRSTLGNSCFPRWRRQRLPAINGSTRYANCDWLS